MSFRGAVGILVMGVLTVAAGCGGGSSTTSTGTSATTATPADPKPYVLADTNGHVLEFNVPTKDVTCDMINNPPGLRCDARNKQWKLPPKPKDCHFDWGQGIEMDAKGPPKIVCGSDTNYNPKARVLPEGQSLQLGPLNCSTGSGGATCTNEKTHHAFFVSVRTYKLH
jgi:hypothetical protein